jgi:hypothetical protein
VVRRLVEQEEICPDEQLGGERRARRLAAGERRARTVQLDAQA